MPEDKKNIHEKQYEESIKEIHKKLNSQTKP